MMINLYLFLELYIKTSQSIKLVYRVSLFVLILQYTKNNEIIYLPNDKKISQSINNLPKYIYCLKL